MLSTSFKFSKKDTPCNCADTKQNCVFLAFPSKLSCVSLLLRNKIYNNYMLLILINFPSGNYLGAHICSQYYSAGQ